MRVYCILVFLICNLVGLAQIVKPLSNQSKISLENANNNCITVLQGGTVINYDLTSNGDTKKLGAYLQKLLSNTSHLSKDVKDGFKAQNELLVEIAKNTAQDGMISLDAYTKGLEKYITENNQLKREIAQLKSQYQDTEFAGVLTKAEEKLNQLDNEGYQAFLEEFKQKQKQKIIQEKGEIAQAAYLQAQNSYNQFQYGQALTQIEESLEYVIRPNYLVLKGQVLGALFRLQEAVDAYLKIDLKAIDDTIKGNVFNYLGIAYMDKGDYEKAIEYYTRSLTIREKVLSKEHPDLATSYNNLGSFYWKSGDYDKAIDYHTKALTIREKVLGNEHPDVGSSYNNLGVAYADKGDYDKAIEYHSKALVIEEKALGTEHPYVATSYNNLGTVYIDKGDYDNGIEFYTKALVIRVKILGMAHPSIATSYNNLGVAYSDKGDYDKAIEYHSKALVIQEKALGPTHSDVATSYNNLGYAYSQKGEYNKAIEFYTNALTIKEKALGPTHPDVATCYNNLCSVYQKNRDYVKAIECCTRALTIWEKVRGIEDPSVFLLFNNLGVAYSDKGDYDKAIEYHMRALAIREKVLGMAHPEVATSYNNLGLAYSDKGDYDKAIECYDKALHIRIDTLGIEDSETQSLFIDISVALIANNKGQEGLSNLQQVRSYNALTGEEKVRSFNKWGLSHFKEGKYQASINFYLLAINELQEEKIPIANELWAAVFQNIAKAYCYTGDKKQALKYFDEAMAFSKGITNAELIKKIQTNVEDCKKR